MDKIFEKIKSDISLCDEAIEKPQNSYMLYRQLIAGYSALIPDFQNGLSKLVKFPGSDYVAEIVEIREKLRMFLIMGSIQSSHNADNVDMSKNKKIQMRKTVLV